MSYVEPSICVDGKETYMGVRRQHWGLKTYIVSFLSPEILMQEPLTRISRVGMYSPQKTWHTCFGVCGISVSPCQVGMFYKAAAFNQDLSRWNVSSVTDMFAMFQNAYAFNGDLSSWDVSLVRNMGALFYSAFLFNQDLSSWDVSSVTNSGSMFEAARSFNQDLCDWRTLLPLTALVPHMFGNAAEPSGCPKIEDPVLPEGPMCHVCI